MGYALTRINNRNQRSDHSQGLSYSNLKKNKSQYISIVIKDYKRKTGSLITLSVSTVIYKPVKDYNTISIYKDLEILTEKNMAP